MFEVVVKVVCAVIWLTPLWGATLAVIVNRWKGYEKW